MGKCFICGNPTKLDFYDFCEECFNSTVEELEKKYERKRAPQTQQDQRKAQPTEDLYRACQPNLFYHRFGQAVKRIFQSIIF